MNLRQALLDLLLLLQGFDEGRFQSVGVLSLKGLLHISRNTLLAYNLDIFANYNESNGKLCMVSISTKGGRGSVLSRARARAHTHTWSILEGGIVCFALLLKLPQRRKVHFALRAAERLLRRRLYGFVFHQEIDDRFQAEQVHEFRVARVRDEVHLWWRWLGWRDLQQCLLQLLAQSHLGGSLTLC